VTIFKEKPRFYKPPFEIRTAKILQERHGKLQDLKNQTGAKAILHLKATKTLTGFNIGGPRSKQCRKFQ
jgi:hypothetical protein